MTEFLSEDWPIRHRYLQIKSPRPSPSRSTMHSLHYSLHTNSGPRGVEFLRHPSKHPCNREGTLPFSQCAPLYSNSARMGDLPLASQWLDVVLTGARSLIIRNNQPFLLFPPATWGFFFAAGNDCNACDDASDWLILVEFVYDHCTPL